MSDFKEKTHLFAFSLHLTMLKAQACGSDEALEKDLRVREVK